MGKIHRLTPVVANQIAAGEVVERPASVIKELLENSLDAEATLIEVEIGEAGEHLEVRDSGVGMDAEDLPLAIERHSTSKLVCLDDLEHSRTLGFRGEALAAIASVSELNLWSRPRGSSQGHRLSVLFGDVGNVVPQAMNPGTRVRVSRLFDRQPGRFKALRTPAAEFGAIQLVVQQLAIGRADVQFRLTRGGRPALDTPGRGDYPAALLALFGREIASDLLPVHYEGEEGLQIRGYLAPAHRHRSNRHGQALYINGRWISNWLIRSAVEEAFRPQVPERRFPYFWLWLEIPLAQVDPNAHPAKAEVRLLRERAVRALTYRAVRETLEKQSQAPKWETHAEEPEPQVWGAASFEWSLPQVGRGEDNTPVLHRQFQDLVPLAQWRAKYIIAQGPQGLCLIDQHAAHERIYFERFKRQGRAITLSQPLLLPLSETLSGAEWATFCQHETDLRQWGFEVESLGGTTVAIRAVPGAFHDLRTHQGLLRTVLELLSGGEWAGGTSHPVSWAEEADYAMAACKAAIKANRPMSMVEMQSLLDDMSRAEDPRGCPHGRPTLIILTLEEVDRRFGRRG